MNGPLSNGKRPAPKRREEEGSPSGAKGTARSSSNVKLGKAAAERPSAGSKPLGSVANKAAQRLIGLEPQPEKLPRPEFTQAHPFEEESVRLPAVELNSVKLVEVAQLNKAKQASQPRVASAPPPPAQPAPEPIEAEASASELPAAEPPKTDLGSEALGELGQSNPIWAEILGRETGKDKFRPRSPAGWDDLPPAEDDPWGLNEAFAEEKPTPHKSAVEDDWFYEPPAHLREHPASRMSRLRQKVEEIVRSRRFSQAIAAMVVLFLISTLDVPWRGWVRKRLRATQQRVVSVINSLNRPIEQRAAFFITEDFQQDLADWQRAEATTARFDSSGLLEGEGLLLQEQTLKYKDYRVDLDAKIQRGALRWVVRATDPRNYYEFRLVERRNSGSFHLQRFAVVDGLRKASSSAIQMPNDLAKSGVFNRVSQRVKDNHITTMINGWGVDYWSDGQLKRGGVGLLAAAGEKAYIQKMTISGNDDAWGLLLYGAAETLKSIRDTVSSPLASAYPHSAPLAVVLHPVRLAPSGR